MTASADDCRHNYILRNRAEVGGSSHADVPAKIISSCWFSKICRPSLIHVHPLNNLVATIDTTVNTITYISHTYAFQILLCYRSCQQSANNMSLILLVKYPTLLTKLYKFLAGYIFFSEPFILD
jgi:hypothetical protein